MFKISVEITWISSNVLYYVSKNSLHRFANFSFHFTNISIQKYSIYISHKNTFGNYDSETKMLSVCVQLDRATFIMINISFSVT